MTDKKLTDNEIVKAWDVLAKLDFFGGQRAGRELWNEKPVDIQNRDIENFSKDIVFLKDLINRQKAEIEQWQKNCDELYQQMSERLKAELKIERRLAKAEAYKEFAEGLKTRAINRYNEYDNQEFPYATITHIDELLKELVGEDKCSQD